MTLILISAMALVLTQCTAKPAKRMRTNAVGAWIGLSSIEGKDNKNGNNGERDTSEVALAAGLNIKHLNPKFICNSFFNVNSGIYYFGKGYDIRADASFNLLTDDLFYNFWLDGAVSGGPFQFYAGPALGVNLMSRNGKPLRHPTLGISAGWLMSFPKDGKYPLTRDLSLEVVILKGIMIRAMYNLYLI